VKLVQPPGDRSCRTGGGWKACRDASTGANYWMQEFSLLERTLAPSNFELLRQELHFKMRKAEAGRLNYGHDLNVELLACAPTVLELRLSARPGEHGRTCLIRLYFTEPDVHSEMLLALKLAWKQPGPMGLEEQNGHARNAAWRADRYLAM
jgi:hypothetical protein